MKKHPGINDEETLPMDYPAKLDHRVILPPDPFDTYIDNLSRYSELYIARDCAPPKARDKIILKMAFCRDAAKKAFETMLKAKRWA